MNNKTKWIWNTQTEQWRLQVGDFLLQVYKPFGMEVWHYDVFEHDSPRVLNKPALSLSTAKRMATKWLRQQTRTNPQDEEQAQTLDMASELERLSFMEARALSALTYAKSEEEKELVLKILGRGE